MDGWNFIEGPSKPRSWLRRWDAEKKEESVSIGERIARVRVVIMQALREFPDAYRAVVDALHAELEREEPLLGGT